MLKLIKALTLIEILIVILIVGILAALAIPNLGTMKEGALDREAKANLKLIQAAEKIYKIEFLEYWPAAGTGDVNDQLKLALPASADSNWSYFITTTDGSDFDATVTRENAPAGWERQFRINNDGEICCVSGNCPSDIPPC